MSCDFSRGKNLSLSKIQDKGEAELNKTVSIPEVEKIAEKEWKVYISNLAWERIQKKFSEGVRKAF